MPIFFHLYAVIVKNANGKTMYAHICGTKFLAGSKKFAYNNFKVHIITDNVRVGWFYSFSGHKWRFRQFFIRATIYHAEIESIRQFIKTKINGVEWRVFMVFFI